MLKIVNVQKYKIKDPVVNTRDLTLKHIIEYDGRSVDKQHRQST